MYISIGCCYAGLPPGISLMTAPERTAFMETPEDRSAAMDSDDSSPVVDVLREFFQEPLEANHQIKTEVSV